MPNIERECTTMMSPAIRTMRIHVNSVRNQKDKQVRNRRMILWNKILYVWFW